MNKLKKDDLVKVIAGKDKGKEGKILSFDTDTDKVTVEKINIKKKHKKGTQEQAPAIVEISAPIHVSNVMLICPVSKKATKVSFKKNNGKKMRVLKVSGELIH